MRSLRLIAVALLLVGVACTSGQPQAPAETRLRERVAAVHAAMGAGDVVTRYEMTPPSSRRRMSLDEFKRDIRWEERGSKNAPARWQAEVARVCSCRTEDATRCVLAVRVAIEEPGKARTEDIALEAWDYEAGDWYLAYVGASTGGRCPGER